MKVLLVSVFLMLSAVAYADKAYVKCYSSGKLFYSGHFKEVYEQDGFLFIPNRKTIDIIGADCLVRFPRHPKK